MTPITTHAKSLRLYGKPCSRHLSPAPTLFYRRLSKFAGNVRRSGIIFRNIPKTGSGTARHRTHGRRLDAGPFSRFIFDPTQSAFKKFGNPESGRFPLVTLFVFQKKYCCIFLFPHFGIQFVTKIQNRNTLSTAEGSLPAAVFGGGRAPPAYRHYPA